MGETMAAIRIIVPQVPDAALSPNASRYQHWGTKTRARDEFARSAWAVCYDAVAQSKPIAGPVKVTARICWPRGRKRMDADNASATLKAMLDAFTKARLWQDDKQIRELDVQQERLDAVGNATWPAGCIVVDVQEIDG